MKQLMKMEAIDKGILIDYSNPIKIYINLDRYQNIFKMIEGFASIGEELALELFLQKKIKKILGKKPQFVEFLNIMKKTLEEKDIEVVYSYSGDDYSINSYISKINKKG